MNYILKSNVDTYFVEVLPTKAMTYILTTVDEKKAKVFTIKDIRNGVVNDLIYKCSKNHGIIFNLVAIREDEDEIPESYDTIFNIFKRQLSKGIEKYGQDVDMSDLTAEEWVDHSLEEIADLMVYLVKLKGKLKEMSNDDKL
ncbi:hypothetical protein GA-1p04 [Bacillus phage GA1]|uniref:Uncharacterized protein n=1 Tax=Bacillus phage GA-1 TaxID=2679898 RepID=Q9FZX4_BPGA1|nr:hypothetical protein GA-1p04 [Bacillus phage GA1]CAC21519.1 hypothetical protein [Bacillus phage GA1]